uniref:Secreted protein n=1 Tax=Zea mays TaxID=4577 RepID=B6TGC6_MAIZE|nr:hypothetical protein [Zea mays]
MFLAPGSPPSSCSVFLYALLPLLLVRYARRIFASSTEIYNKNMELRRDSQGTIVIMFKQFLSRPALLLLRATFYILCLHNKSKKS